MDPKDSKKVAVNLDGVAFSFILALTSVFVLSPGNHDVAKPKQWRRGTVTWAANKDEAPEFEHSQRLWFKLFPGQRGLKNPTDLGPTVYPHHCYPLYWILWLLQYSHMAFQHEQFHFPQSIWVLFNLFSESNYAQVWCCFILPLLLLVTICFVLSVFKGTAFLDTRRPAFLTVLCSVPYTPCKPAEWLWCVHKFN